MLGYIDEIVNTKQSYFLMDLWCNRCLSKKPEEDFYRNKRRTTGRDGYCISCMKKLGAESYARHSEKRKVMHKKWAMVNRERRVEYQREWRQENKERCSEYDRKSYAANRQKRLAADKMAREANKEKFLQRERDSYARTTATRTLRRKKWAECNKYLIRMYAANRRAVIRDRTPEWLTDAHYEEIKTTYEFAAKITEETGVLHHVDHIVPLCGRTVSGLHVPWNLSVITAKDNLRKNNTTWPDKP